MSWVSTTARYKSLHPDPSTKPAPPCESANRMPAGDRCARKRRRRRAWLSPCIQMLPHPSKPTPPPTKQRVHHPQVQGGPRSTCDDSEHCKPAKKKKKKKKPSSQRRSCAPWLHERPHEICSPSLIRMYEMVDTGTWNAKVVDWHSGCVAKAHSLHQLHSSCISQQSISQ
uniref:Uncharacterized protein n=1 Tax=Physcomitrium patens TaxID=3218 RepID=A0A2K1KQA3_PHYPA|nr:hypothetical protein PHYPA_006846 [Physcomitrium patens]